MFPRPSIVTMLLLLTAAGSPALTVHVAPGGDDAAEGSEGAPLATLSKALGRLRESGDPHREVRLAPGRYQVQGGVSIGASDSGRPGRPLKISGKAPGVVLSGFKPLSPGGWAPVAEKADFGRLGESVRDRVVQYQFGGSDRVRLGRLSRRGFDADERREPAPAMLYLGRCPMTLARWPNDGVLTTKSVVDAGPVRSFASDGEFLEFWERGGRFEIDSTRPAGWQEPGDAWVNGRFGFAWEWSVNRVGSVSGTVVELQHGEVSGIGADDLRPPEFYFENVLEEIDRPGEYYIDSDRGLLFFLPPDDGGAWRRLARLSWCEDPILNLVGARHVEFSNLAIEGGREHGVVVEGGLNIAFDRVQIRACAGDGLVADGREVRIHGLLAEGLGGGGVVLSGGDPKTLRTSGHKLSRSRFVDLGRWDRAWRPAVDLRGVGHEVRDCEFADLPHMAIEASGNEFRIEGCWFHRTCTDFGDMCAIYFNEGGDPHHRGTVISGNLFQNIGVGTTGASRGAVYLDNGTMGVTVVDNVFHRVGEGDGGWAVMNHGGAHITVDRNVFIDCPVPLHVGYWWATYGKDEFPLMLERWQNLLTSDKTVVHRLRYPELGGFLNEDRVHPTSNTFRGNRIANPRRPLQAEGGVSVFGGPRAILGEGGNIVSREFSGLSFDDKGRPVIPGARPWQSAAVSLR